MTPAFYGLIGVLVTACISLLVSFRRLSGRIGSSEAESLWTASEQMRAWVTERLKDAEKRQIDLEKRIADLEAANNALRRENVDLREENLRHARTIERLNERLDSIDNENQSLRNTIRRLAQNDPGE